MQAYAACGPRGLCPDRRPGLYGAADAAIPAQALYCRLRTEGRSCPHASAYLRHAGHRVRLRAEISVRGSRTRHNGYHDGALQTALLSAHREENIDTEENFRSLFTAVNAMAAQYDLPVLYSCHPRSRKRLEESGFQLDRRVIAHKPLGFHDYNCLQMNAFCVVSDSGTLPEESSFYLSVGKPFPAVCIRTSTERPEALDKGCFVLSGIHTEQLLQSIDLAVQMQQNGEFGTPVPDYTTENVSVKVARIIQSYTGIVDRFVWRK
ncbi:MAG: UDP-N-acetylglucosamine 2-epimerase [Firmicutes bacterium]|nr:UDP-N-acetylglucosamine 2-epimerase [Bacillota bacterium]